MIGLGLSVPTVATLTKGVRARRVAIAVVGQSNEQGRGKNYNGGTVTQTTSWVMSGNTSTKNPAANDPIAPITTAYSWGGSMWPILTDLMWSRGLRPTWRNCAINSLAFRANVAQQVQQWAANRAYYCQRSPEVAGDYGDKGSIITPSYGYGKLFRCIVGSKRAIAMTGNGPFTVGTTTYAAPFAALALGSDKKTGASAPNWSSITAVGQTLTDGDITWECIAIGASPTVGDFYAYTSAEFDPIGVLQRAKDQLDAITDVSEKWVFVENAQGDLGNSSAVYQSALTAMVNWCLAQGYKVALGLSCWDGLDANAAADYAALDTGWANTLASFAGNPNVIAGANLYRALGHIAINTGDGYTSFLSPESNGATQGLHLTNYGLGKGNSAGAAQAWRDALLASGW
jgi:hypothetical protein